MGRGLLAKFEAGSAQTRGASEDLARQIADHLRVLLNTRQGNASTVPTYGLSDFTDLVHEYPKSIPQLQSAIRSTILEFEPRLKNVVVKQLEGDPLVLNFEITAQSAESPRGTLRFRTRVSPSGKVEVR